MSDWLIDVDGRRWEGSAASATLNLPSTVPHHWPRIKLLGVFGKEKKATDVVTISNEKPRELVIVLGISNEVES